MAWCVAKPGSTDQMLQAGLDYACNHADCGPIQQGGSCFDPNTLVQHAAFAINMYYQSMGRHKWDCDFNDSALLSLTDPSKPPSVSNLKRAKKKKLLFNCKSFLHQLTRY